MPSSQAPSIAGVAIDPTALRGDYGDAEIVRVTADTLRPTLARLKGEGFTMLLDIGGVDYLHREPRFDVAYHLLAVPTRVASVAEVATPRRMRVLCGVPNDAPSVPTIVDLWPNADWAEREVFDLYGITFTGHPDLRRIELPNDFVGHPLRKDYPLRGPAEEATPRPPFALKSNVPAGAPPGSKVAAALQKQIARARGQAEPSAPEEKKNA